ncbi:NAD(P)H-hydrate dehydratase [Rhizobium halophytocola]|uniref:Bifunctional NAD(P)H-hydrate repair enzyme n=1 Tax=Rhizobium halophytocola TaxID=735519 RepID=A0ABS4DWQ8_9HYPH|nr:NAD(P)H-hydrate dehydratase [Rhizobium halophytocola]MBP1850100.1 NAD(P)H-hydrate epimerase [Rhizobium halophytocola]
MLIPSHTLLAPDEMAEADRRAALSGLSSYGLMEQAGRAVAAEVLRHFPVLERAVVLCGPGNNGGDGYVAARVLAESGVPVALFYLGDPDRLKGDAERAHRNCKINGAPLSAYRPDGGKADGDVVIDALFGAGLARPLEGEVKALVEAVNEAECPVVAVDLPSGIDGRTGRVMGAALRAQHTITFMARKPGHLLLPGRDLCGHVTVTDIGIPARIVAACAGRLAENGPAVWQASLPRPETAQHKFVRGHLMVFSGGPSATGAGRLSAAAGLRTGAGLVTIAAPGNALSVLATQLTAVMLKRIDDLDGLEGVLEDKRLTAFVLGPGFGIGERARAFALALSGRALVLDADGISSFSEDPQSLFDAFRQERGEEQGQRVLTPHEGEFARLFADIAGDRSLGKVEKARAAASRANAVIVYKGADTVIAAPDGRALINANAPPWLATAGSGDVLAGIIGALLAQKMPAFEAAAAGVWLHGDAGGRLGAGLTAEDLVGAIGPALAGLLAG